MTAMQLARVAEKQQEFFRAIPDLFGLGTRDQCSSQDVWDMVVKFANQVVPELLQRCGYYHGVISGKAPQPYYRAIMGRIAPAYRQFTTLYLLNGCRFAKSRFKVAGHSILRLSATKLEALGPSRDVCDDFFPSEAIDSRSFTNYWFVNVTKPTYTAYNYDLDGDDPPKGKERQKIGELEVAAEHYASGSQTEFSLPDYLEAVLGLALYNPTFFEIPLILLCEPQWRRIRIRSNPIQRREKYYEVSQARWPFFKRWLRLYESGLRNAEGGSRSRPVITALRRYSQATFATGDIFSEWRPETELIEYPSLPRFPPDRPDVFEDALLHYVFALEALLSGEETSAISEKLAVICSLLVSRDDREADFVRKFVKEAYHSRSLLVHGRNLKKLVDLSKLRRLCQRALVLTLCYFAKENTPELDNFTRDLPISGACRKRVRELQEIVLPYLADSNSLAD
jgi:hypothetical protein